MCFGIITTFRIIYSTEGSCSFNDVTCLVHNIKLAVRNLDTGAHFDAVKYTLRGLAMFIILAAANLQSKNIILEHQNSRYQH